MNSQEIIKLHLKNLDTIENLGRSIYIGRKLVRRCMKYIETRQELMWTKPLVMLLHIYVTIAASLTSNGRRMSSSMALILGTPERWQDLESGSYAMGSIFTTRHTTTDIIRLAKLIYKKVLVQPTTLTFGQYYHTTSTYTVSLLTRRRAFITTRGQTVITTNNKLKC